MFVDYFSDARAMGGLDDEHAKHGWWRKSPNNTFGKHQISKGESFRKSS